MSTIMDVSLGYAHLLAMGLIAAITGVLIIYGQSNQTEILTAFGAIAGLGGYAVSKQG